ncbi:PREDICTED: uncharacterized protein LOC107335151 isoform X2 [Acropora digitifera]|uniref:uncharacterized protein LOC107335151 isoform X2 n=1 Tax=Acropora digitifera TaxID=70779 RepID=UPI00077A776E|nr:PREDICTED: uncharacterized protein LOC107335151 isoform X2 [Acropora digitifera]
MNLTCGPSERVDLGSLDDPANVPGTYNQGGSSDIQMISAKPKEIPTQVEGVCEIIPVSGSVEGRYPFNISLTEPLPDDVVSGMAEFEGVETVALTRINPYTFSGLVPGN